MLLCPVCLANAIDDAADLHCIFCCCIYIYFSVYLSCSVFVQAGFAYMGGKMDDITVLIAKVVCVDGQVCSALMPLAVMVEMGLCGS